MPSRRNRRSSRRPMSAIDGHNRPRAELRHLPEFDLSYLFDDDDEPSEVTVFPARFDDDLATNWITIDYRHAVPLDRIR